MREFHDTKKSKLSFLTMIIQCDKGIITYEELQEYMNVHDATRVHGGMNTSSGTVAGE